jgi:hypothetical protein
MTHLLEYDGSKWTKHGITGNCLLGEASQKARRVTGAARKTATDMAA